MADRRAVWGIELGHDPSTLELLIHDVYGAIANRPTELLVLKQAIVALLSFLASAEGRTDENCHDVDTFSVSETIGKPIGLISRVSSS